MDARQRWQALQARLTAARAAVDAGDRDTALSEIAAALELDGEFLAAHALRDTITAMGETPAQSAPVAELPAAKVAPAEADTIFGVPAGYAKFEHRAKRLRVDRRLDAARAAIEQRRLNAAAIALDEVIELDPNLPELAELTARFDELRRADATPHRGPWIAAAAVFFGAVLAGSWIEDPSTILTRQIVSAAPLPEPLTPMVAVSEPVTEVDSTAPSVATLRPTAIEVAPRTRDVSTIPPPMLPRPPIEAIAAPAPPAHVAEPTHILIDAAAIPPASMPVPPAVQGPDDTALVKQALQRYRTAYEGLDAQSAQAVWPAVNQAALAKAFDGLESQSLTFDACDVRVRGEGATAICRGSARYVTKVGSRDPRVEPRVWNFTLRKAGSDWKIDSARAER